MESEDVGLGKAKASLSLFLAFEGEGDQDWDPKWCLFPLKKTNHLVLLGWGVSIPPLLILCGSTIWSHYQWPLPLCPPPWYGGTFQRFRQVHPPISFSNLIGMWLVRRNWNSPIENESHFVSIKVQSNLYTYILLIYNYLMIKCLNHIDGLIQY